MIMCITFVKCRPPGLEKEIISCEMFSNRLKRGAGSSVLCLPLVIYWMIGAQTNQGRFLPTFGHIGNKSCQSCKAGRTNSSRFLAGMHSVDIAEYSMPRGMSNNMQQRSLKQQLLVWKDCASDPLNLGRPKSGGFISRTEESLLCFFLWPQIIYLICRWPSNTPLPLFQSQCHDLTVPDTWKSTTAQGSRMRHFQCQNARLVGSSLYLPAGQSRIQASSLHSANSKRPSERPSKTILFFKLSWARRLNCLPWKQVSWNHLSVAHLHFVFPRF